MNKILKFITFIIIVVLGFTGCNVFQKEKKNEETEVVKAEQKKDEEGSNQQEAALPVKVITIKRGNLPLRLNISASADTWEKADVKAEISGTVKDIKVSIGDWVQKGQILIQLDDKERRLAVTRQEAEKLRTFSQYLVKEDLEIEDQNTLSEEQKAKLDQLKQAFQKAAKDFEQGKIPQQQFDKISDEYQKELIFSGKIREEVRKAQEGLSSAIVSLKESQLNLERTSIRSPFPGVIANLQVSKGETVNAGQVTMRVVNLKTLYLKGFALESEVQHLREGTNVRIRFDSYPDRYFYGEIQSISPEIDQDNKTISVYVKIDNKDNLFLPGMHAEIDLEYKVFENVIKVPRNAVVYRQERYLVFTVKDLEGLTGTANWVYVDIGNQNDEEIEIKTNLAEGDLVVVEGQLTLAHQSKVKIEN